MQSKLDSLLQLSLKDTLKNGPKKKDQIDLPPVKTKKMAKPFPKSIVLANKLKQMKINVGKYQKSLEYYQSVCEDLVNGIVKIVHKIFVT